MSVIKFQLGDNENGSSRAIIFREELKFETRHGCPRHRRSALDVNPSMIAAITFRGFRLERDLLPGYKMKQNTSSRISEKKCPDELLVEGRPWWVMKEMQFNSYHELWFPLPRNCRLK
jgi:hypothetical protein